MMQKIAQFSLLFLSLIALAGCQTAAQREASRIAEGSQAANIQFVACINELMAKPVYQPIVRRFATPPTPGARPAIERIADPDFASPEEARLLVSYFDEGSVCVNQFAVALDNLDPSQAALLRGFLVDAGRRTLALIRQEITWGVANQQYDNAALALSSAARENERRTIRQLEAAHTSELARRQAALEALSAAGAAMQQAAIQQEMLNASRLSAFPRRSTTSCVRTGNVVNCDTF